MDFKTINELATEVHKNAVAKGFWENNPSDEHFLCLVISELMEAVEADRKGWHAKTELFKKNARHITADLEKRTAFRNSLNGYFEIYIKETIEDEISDAFIRLLDLAGAREYDLDHCHHLDVVTPKRTFTENVYAIIQEVVKEGYTTFGHVLHSIQNIIKLAEILGFDLEYHVRLKMRYNALREYKHGKAY